MTTNSSILYWDRQKLKEEQELVYGDHVLRWIYETRSGQGLAKTVLSRAFFSKIYGYYQSSKMSRRKIEPFIRQFKIPMEEYEPGPYLTFNDFFVRKFTPGARQFCQDPSHFPAFAEARYFA